MFRRGAVGSRSGTAGKAAGNVVTDGLSLSPTDISVPRLGIAGMIVERLTEQRASTLIGASLSMGAGGVAGSQVSNVRAATAAERVNDRVKPATTNAVAVEPHPLPPVEPRVFGQASTVEATLRAPPRAERSALGDSATRRTNPLHASAAIEGAFAAVAPTRPRVSAPQTELPVALPVAERVEEHSEAFLARVAAVKPLPADGLAPLPPKDPPKSADKASGGDLMINSMTQTDFDVNQHRIVFAGNVSMRNDNFFLTSNRLVAYMKKESDGLDFAEAQGNVTVKLLEAGRETGSSGISQTAVYYPGSGEIRLRGWPKLQTGNKAHIASTATTEMSLFTDGRMRTSGRNQTVILK